VLIPNSTQEEQSPLPEMDDRIQSTMLEAISACKSINLTSLEIDCLHVSQRVINQSHLGKPNDELLFRRYPQNVNPSPT
jgi:hypothetical protein